LADKRPHVLVPITRESSAGGLLGVAEAVLRGENGSGQMLGVVAHPFGRPVAENVTVARRYRALLRRISALQERRYRSLGVQVRVANTVAQGVREAAYENSTDLIVMDWPDADVATRASVEDLLESPPSDLVLVRPARAERPDALGVLVPVRGGPSAQLALRIAAALAAAWKQPFTALHVRDSRHSPERQERDSRQFHQLVRESGDDCRVVEVESRNPSEAINAEGQKYGVVVLGAYAEVSRTHVVVGSRLARAVEALQGTVILAKSPRALADISDSEAPTPLALQRPQDLSAMVDRWFAENTFHSREFRDVRRLVELKQRQGLTISLALPTLNEAATIRDVVSVLKSTLMQRHPLLDEIVVIDSGSEDGTIDIARSLGVPVYQHPQILSELGTFRGKGEALWKSLHQVRGDIVAWCDTDISNIQPQFVYGTVGPLLTDRRIGFVKGFYRRPLEFGGELHTAGGGRVTELAARPLLNLFYPELSGLVQPLSGEYAGRRELLERMPFFTGYGVEIGHLIDLLENFGLNTIAQTDLGVRIHRNQDLLDLSKMAFAIMQVALKRLGDRHRMHLVEAVNRSMKLIHYANGPFFLEVVEIADHERPPMASIPEYVHSRDVHGSHAAALPDQATVAR